MTTAEMVEAALTDAEARAWEALSGYKFWMFGYHAAQWVLLNRLRGGGNPNPWRELVALARERIPGGASA